MTRLLSQKLCNSVMNFLMEETELQMLVSILASQNYLFISLNMNMNNMCIVKQFTS